MKVLFFASRDAALDRVFSSNRPMVVGALDLEPGKVLPSGTYVKLKTGSHEIVYDYTYLHDLFARIFVNDSEQYGIACQWLAEHEPDKVEYTAKEIPIIINKALSVSG